MISRSVINNVQCKRSINAPELTEMSSKHKAKIVTLFKVVTLNTLFYPLFSPCARYFCQRREEPFQQIPSGKALPFIKILWNVPCS